MFVITWLKGILKLRWGYMLGTILGTAITIALLASISSFITYSGESMTKNSLADIPVDWQVQMTGPAKDKDTLEALKKTTAYTNIEKVTYADSAGFESSKGDTVQTTGPGKVLGISANYNKKFPGEMRLLVGTTDGVLVAQQSAANLHIGIGDNVTILRKGLSAVNVKVSGIVDLPNADTLFQTIGLPAGAAPQAPPDNVLLMPIKTWHQIFDAQANKYPASVISQFHVRLNHNFCS